MTKSGNSKGYKVWEPTLLALCTVLGLLAGSQLLHPQPGTTKLQPARYDRGHELNEIVRFIEEKYVDEVNADALIRSAVDALLKNLDPHSGYLTPDEVADLNEKMEGHFRGIGIEFHRVLDTAVVLYVYPDGPADKAGMKMLDRIVYTNDSLLVSPELTEKDMVTMLRGIKESEIRVKVVRPSVDTFVEMTIERDEIPIKSVVGAYMIRPEIGYIRINRFSSKTYKDFMEHLERLTQKEGMQDLIIDVRQNPGGYLKEAVNILSQLFEEKGLLLVFTEGENAPRAEYHTTGKPFYPVSKILVLVDEGSASASEILAGALQDHDRGVIIGSPTYGKGLVQEQYSLSNGGALRLTVARYYTPSGRLIQKPYSNGEAVEQSNSETGDSVQYYTSEGREVRGAGGITPDILVRPDVDWHNKRYGELYDAVLEYAIHGFRDSVRYQSIQELIDQFPAADVLVLDMLRYYENHPRENRTVDQQFISESASQVRMLLMGMISSSYFGHASWYEVMNADDPVVKKALEVIKDDIKTTLRF